MCCFTGPVHDVTATNIFARVLPDGRQFLAYGMTVGLSGEVAMVLPIPTPAAASEQAATFVDMSSCPKFFDALDALYPKDVWGGFAPAFAPAGDAIAKPLLTVHAVGAFEASFVPSIQDFGRLDPRFRLPPSTWQALPEYADWGFAVFKLQRAGDVQRVHPMAFTFERRNRDAVFFPTVHVHDGVIHESATFDHTLYSQVEPEWVPLMSAYRAPTPTSAITVEARAFVDVEGPMFREVHRGDLPNDDIWIRGELLRGRHYLGEGFCLRVHAGWDLLRGTGRGRPRSPAGLSPDVWRELQIPESERVRARDIAGAVFASAVRSRGAAWQVIPFRADLPQVQPSPTGFPGAPVMAPPPHPCLATFFNYAGRVMGIGVTIAFASMPTLEAVLEIQNVLREAIARVNAG
jgi:hypothetical protein